MKQINHKVSIIVPFYGNQDEVVIETINSLKKINHKNLKLILIDNGSTSKVSKKISKDYPEVNLIISKENLGVCGGRNIGIKNLDGDEDFVIFFDSDQVAGEDMVTELIKPMLYKNDIGITTPKILYHPDFIDSKAPKKYQDDLNLNEAEKIIWSAGTDINLTTGQIIFYGGEDTPELNVQKEVSVAPGVICCKKELLNKLIGFDESYISVYEDTDFCFRAKNLGYKVLYVPTALTWHKIYLDPVGSEKKLLTRLYFVGRNRVIFMKSFCQKIVNIYKKKI